VPSGRLFVSPAGTAHLWRVKPGIKNVFSGGRCFSPTGTVRL
jgi:hypothetical protein